MQQEQGTAAALALRTRSFHVPGHRDSSESHPIARQTQTDCPVIYLQIHTPGIRTTA